MFSKNAGGSFAIQSSSGSSMPRSANSATQSTCTSRTSGSFFAWNNTTALSWKPVNGESTSVSVMSGLSFSNAALNSAMNFSPTSVVFHCDQRTSVAASVGVEQSAIAVTTANENIRMFVPCI